MKKVFTICKEVALAALGGVLVVGLTFTIAFSVSFFLVTAWFVILGL